MCVLSLIGGTGVILRMVVALSLLPLGFSACIAAQHVVLKLQLVRLLYMA
jgi:hypothetical protein